MPDGSLVWLNSESQLQYPEKFSDSTRVVHLVGEAFFEVMKNVRRPFIVQTANLTTTVLGTKFNVNAYKNESWEKVSLVEGLVKVAETERKIGGRKSQLLSPGEEIRYDEQTNKIETRSFDVKYVTGWKEGQLAFKDEPFQAVVKKLSRWYDVDITVQGMPPDGFSLNGVFVNEYLENVLRSISFGRNFDYTLNDKQLTIRFNKN